MKRAFGISLLAVLLLCFCAWCSSGKKPENAQENFGVRMARMNLWREAMFRFKRAVEMSPGDAMAHNNLAVAYEANGDFDNAAKEYREAIRLDKSNQFIQKNYSRYVEFTSRNKKRQQRRETTTRTVATTKEGAAGTPQGVPTTTPAPVVIPPPTDAAVVPPPTPNPPGGHS
jgi:Flp pilus assembly protein TadD